MLLNFTTNENSVADAVPVWLQLLYACGDGLIGVAEETRKQSQNHFMGSAVLALC